MGGKRRAALQEIAEGHAAGAVAQPGGGRTARRKLGEINGVGGGGGKAQKNTGSYKKLHPQSSLDMSDGWVLLPFYDGKGQLFGAAQN